MNSAPTLPQVTAGRPGIEVLSPFGPGEAIQRVKVNAIRPNITENEALKEALGIVPSRRG